MCPGMVPTETMEEKWPAGPVHNDMDFAANTHIILHAGRYLTTVKAGPLTYELYNGDAAAEAKNNIKNSTARTQNAAASGSVLRPG